MTRSRSTTGLASDERALSDTVGFVLTFGIIIVSVGLVSTVGLSELEEFQSDQQLRNAEQTFDLIARSLDEIEESQTTTRTDAIDLNEGSIQVKRGSTARLSVVDTDSGSTYDTTVPLNALLYSADGTDIAYQNGATLRIQRDGGVVKHQPGFVCTDEVAVISIVTLDSPSNRLLGGQSTLRVTSRRTDTELLYPREATGVGNASAADHVDLRIDADWADQWAQYFERTDGNWAIQSTGGSSMTVRCGASSDLDRVYVRQTVVSITFSG